MRPIICVGHAALDHVYRIEAFPPAPAKVRSLEHIESGGGMASNAAAAIGRLGAPVELWSPLRHAGVTRGAEGYFWASADGASGHQPASPVNAVDTTGAGDAFHGGFAWALMQGCEQAECARIAAAVAALKCQRLGARSGLPTLAELKSFLASEK